MSFNPPAFIAFTGVDRSDIAGDLQSLSSRYPIEWGMLIDHAQQGNPLFPTAEIRSELIAQARVRWAAHVCGAEARLIANEPLATQIDLAGFQRVQINHGIEGSNEFQTLNATAFGRRRGVRAVLQCPGAFPGEQGVDWLFDTSFGKGASPAHWPALRAGGAFCGYSGGLNAENVRKILAKIVAPAGALYWIDMESGVRTDGWLDVGRCEAVCRAVYA